MKENQNNYYFTEVWDAAIKDFFWQKTKRALDGYYSATDCILIKNPSSYNPMDIIKEPAPEFLKEWIEHNPDPDIHRDQFIVALAKRVEALEAVLAEKGGAQ